MLPLLGYIECNWRLIRATSPILAQSQSRTCIVGCDLVLSRGVTQVSSAERVTGWQERRSSVSSSGCNCTLPQERGGASTARYPLCDARGRSGRSGASIRGTQHRPRLCPQCLQMTLCISQTLGVIAVGASRSQRPQRIHTDALQRSTQASCGSTAPSKKLQRSGNRIFR